MSIPPTPARIEYPVIVRNVPEVSLRATADLPHWADVLHQEGLHPYQPNGKAEFLIITADLHWMGVKFKEMSISLLISREPDGSTQDGGYLLRAFNSLGAFAFFERALFKTPYYPAAINLYEELPSSVELREEDRMVFHAQMRHSEPPLRGGDEVWEGPIYLPDHDDEVGNLFYARLSGYTEVYPFVESVDTLEIRPSSTTDLFQRLMDTGFTLTEWHLRAKAKHHKSRTYKRDELL